MKEVIRRMKRKNLRSLGVVIGVLFLLFILVGPAAPLWARLGVKPICVQGEWPHIKVVSCPQAQTSSTSLALPNLNEEMPISIIFDDDGSPDGIIALLYFLSNPLFDVRAVTISSGEAHPALFAGHILQLLAGMGMADIPVGAGRETPLEGSNSFPDPWRQASDNFWGIELPPATITMETIPAADLIVGTINNSLEPVMLFISGTHTNLAEALHLDPGIAKNIRDVFIMGGNIYVPGNINSDWPDYDNKVAEWNIWVDPVAADEVFLSGLPLHLVPLDATRQVVWVQSDLPGWKSSTSPEGPLAGSLLEWMLNSWSQEGIYIWDLVAAVQATNPKLCTEVPLEVDIVTTPGSEQGRMLVREESPNVSVCLNPDQRQVKAITAAVLGNK
jgi:pyrimidine-specific ribonucleoside hydrolase